MFRTYMRLHSLSRCLRAKVGLLLATLLLAPLAVQAQPHAPNCCNAPGSNCQTETDWVQGFYDYVYFQCQPQAHASGLGGSANSGGAAAQGRGGRANSGGGVAPVVPPVQPSQDAQGFQDPLSNPDAPLAQEPPGLPIAFTAKEPEEISLRLVEQGNSKPPISPVGEMLDLAEQGQLPSSNPDQEHLPDMQRCSTKPYTLWHLRNCAYASGG